MNTKGNCSRTSRVLDRRTCSQAPTRHEAWLPATVGCQHVILYFMCRFTCSRCWRTALQLAKFEDWLRENNTTVVLIGDDRYIEPASRLAAEIGIPFPLLADGHGTLKRLYGIHRQIDDSCHGALVLVDKHGVARFGHECASAKAPVDISDLLGAVEVLGLDDAHGSRYRKNRNRSA